MVAPATLIGIFCATAGRWERRRANCGQKCYNCGLVGEGTPPARPVGDPGRLTIPPSPFPPAPAASRRTRNVRGAERPQRRRASLHGTPPTGAAMSSTNAKPQTRQPAAQRGTRTSRKNTAAASMLTSERIAADLAAFRKNGGKIEVLGNTKVFKSAGPMLSASKKTAARKTPAEEPARIQPPPPAPPHGR